MAGVFRHSQEAQRAPAKAGALFFNSTHWKSLPRVESLSYKRSCVQSPVRQDAEGSSPKARILLHFPRPPTREQRPQVLREATGLLDPQYWCPCAVVFLHMEAGWPERKFSLLFLIDERRKMSLSHWNQPFFKMLVYWIHSTVTVHKSPGAVGLERRWCCF